MDLPAVTLRATVLLLGAAGVLASLGRVGVGASVPLVVVLALVAAGAYAARAELAEAGRAVGPKVGWYAGAAWVSLSLAAGAAAVGLSSTPAELQAVGGLVGLVGMANHFLRPVYSLVARLGRAVAGPD